jgi:DNA-binding NtrC family response regulator
LENALLARNKGGDAPAVRHQIVVIDDDLASRGSLAFVFKSQYDVITCATAKEGVAAVNEETCAVILDIRMPEQDGFSACDEIRRLYPDMPILFYSAYQNAKDPLEIINDHRPFAYVVKGGDLDKLVRLVGLAVQLQAVIVKNRRLLNKLQAEREAAR